MTSTTPPALEPSADQVSAVRATVRRLPDAPGVYRFRDLQGRAMYLGRATRLRSRIASYWGDLSGRAHLRRMVRQIGSVEAVECASVHEAAWLERNLLERGLLRWNRTRGGAEVPTWLVLDASSRTPSLQTRHEPVATRLSFGPFLGGDRARLACSGLLRVWPLGLVGESAGSVHRDLARVRGVGTDDASSMIEQIVAALSGEMTAIEVWRAGLLTARDRAVEHLGFELAARITDELTALEWATSVQRVTAGVGVQREREIVVGWCAGVTTEFEIVDGRMNRWRQRLVDREPARALAQTPEVWRGFAEQNAHLAATLLGRV